MATQFKQKVKSLRNIQLTESINCAHSTFRSIVCLIIFFQCSEQCGNGFLEVLFLCKQRTGTGKLIQVSSEFCMKQKKPYRLTRRKCKVKECKPKFTAEDWSEVSICQIMSTIHDYFNKQTQLYTWFGLGLLCISWFNKRLWVCIYIYYSNPMKM